MIKIPASEAARSKCSQVPWPKVRSIVFRGYSYGHVGRRVSGQDI